MTEISAFNEQIVVTPVPVAGWITSYNVNNRMVKTTLANGGTVTASNSRALLQTSTDPDGSAKMETRRVLRYTPGQGGLVRFTAVFASGGAPGSRQLVGVGDANDGFFFGYDGEAFGVLLRTAGNDVWTPQTQWNIYPFLEQDKEADFALGNVFQIRYQWLGYGPSRSSVQWQRTGNYREVHHNRYTNTSLDTSIRNPTLPLCAWIENMGNTSNLQLYTGSGMLFTEGPIRDKSLHPLTLLTPFEAAKSVTTEEPILSIQAATTFHSITSRVVSQLSFISLATDGNKNVTIRIYRNGTLTGASFVDFDTDDSTLSFDVDATAIANGEMLPSVAMAKADSRVIPFDDLGIEIMPGESLTITAQSSVANEVTVGLVMLEKF